MAKVLTYEGIDSQEYGACPVCDGHSYQGFGQADTQFIMSNIQGGAIGAGVAAGIDMLAPKVVPQLGPIPRSLLTAALSIGIAYYLKDRNAALASGIGIGGTAVAVKKIIDSLSGKVITVGAGGETAGLEGYDDLGADYDEDYMGAYGQDDLDMDEMDYDEMGVLVPEEFGQQEEFILE